MTREIKFRAWDNEASEFITDYDTGDHSDLEFSGGGADVIQKDLVDACVNGEHEQYEEYKRFSENIEIMQYTGLKDKKGVEIYEGDIVLVNNAGRHEDYGKSRSSRRCEIIWSEHNACFDTKVIKVINDEGIFLSVKNKHWEYRAEVIGNIHENPELLNRDD